MYGKLVFSLIVFACSLPLGELAAQSVDDKTPNLIDTTRPWTRWWWMGNAVDETNIRSSLIRMREVGLGGVEITPIYGVVGEEANDLKYLSPRWMEMLRYTIRTADSLGLGVDMNLGTGWPYGGPQVTPQYAATKLIIDQWQVAKGKRLKFSAVPKDEKERPNASLSHLLAFAEDGRVTDLRDQLKRGKLKWKAREADYVVYAVYTGKTGQMVKRAAPGGEGFTLDHFSKEALDIYLRPFGEAFEQLSGKPRAIFNDSYEVYGTDFTPDFFSSFRTNRGYDLLPHLPWLMDTTGLTEGIRIRADYRRTIGELLLTRFNRPWTGWAHQQGSKTRLQAHGSPGNLIDLYASADIPECETFGSMPYDILGFRREEENIRPGNADRVMLRFASSAAHLAGRPLVSSETFTWLRDHFKTALSHCKPEVEDLFLSGVNHTFLHGSTYSPERAAWPGWKFYAAVNFHPNNSIWADAPALFSYVENCQSMLQAGTPDNDLLLYWPIHDVWDDSLGRELAYQFNIHAVDEWLTESTFYRTANNLLDQGYGVDFISDTFISEATAENGKLILPGGAYKAIVIPDCDKMPLETLRKLISLREAGVTVIFTGLPESVPGFHEYQEREAALLRLLAAKRDVTSVAKELISELEAGGIMRESVVDSGLKFIRRRQGEGYTYFLVNHTDQHFKAYVPLRYGSDTMELYDPLNGAKGIARTRRKDAMTQVKVDIPSGRSIFLTTVSESDLRPWTYREVAGEEYPIRGKWRVDFLSGGPVLPQSLEMPVLQSWTEYGQEAEHFSGTARYSIDFSRPEVAAENWLLRLGDVRESAKVWLNDEFLGTVWSLPFTLTTGALLPENTLRIEVTNLPANRVRAKEMRGEEWKVFREINMVDKDYLPFDATRWEPVPSGILGEVTLTPLRTSSN